MMGENNLPATHAADDGIGEAAKEAVLPCLTALILQLKRQALKKTQEPYYIW